MLCLLLGTHVASISGTSIPRTQLPNNTLQEAGHVEQARADFYALLSALLMQAPNADFLHAIAHAGAIDGAAVGTLADAWQALALGTARSGSEAVREEFESLFVSTSDPRVHLHGSFYLAGFLMDTPLADLRADLGRLRLSRREGATELEDHLAVLFETMRVLIEQGRPLALQQQFFERHIHSWAARCTDDLRRAGANFYSLVADFIDAFLAVEAEAFAMSEHGEQQ